MEDVSDLLRPLDTLPQFRELLTAEVRNRLRSSLETKLSGPVLRNLTPTQVIPLLEKPAEFPNLIAVADYRREYPASDSAALLVGHLGAIAPEELASLDTRGYLPDDEIGKAGLEASFEEALAGRPGREERRRDARGRPLGEPKSIEQAQPGADIHTTLRGSWQAKAHELLHNRKGSVVVLDASDGSLRVLASAPAFLPEQPGAAALPDGTPTSHFNRAARGLYPPGSTLKPFVVLAAAGKGIDLARRVNCTGRVTIRGWDRPFHCNVRTGHGSLDAIGAIAQSCNVYFFTLAQEIGAEPMLEEAAEFGLGSATGSEVPGEAEGQLSKSGAIDRGEALNLSIGQGTMLVTVLQVARAYAALANGGSIPTPHVVERIVYPDGRETRPVDGSRTASATMPAAARATVLEGMWRGVNDPSGTAFKAQFDPAWQVCGKTGTAEKAGGAQDAWFAGFYPRNAPKYVVVVHIEESEGHGGEEAAPVAAELIRFIETGATTESPEPAT